MHWFTQEGVNPGWSVCLPAKGKWAQICAQEVNYLGIHQFAGDINSPIEITGQLWIYIIMLPTLERRYLAKINAMLMHSPLEN